MSNLSEWTLLYVEDDSQLRGQFMRILKQHFRKVYEASDGVEALEHYEQYSPDMMLMDINMPKLDGLKVIEKVRSKDKTTPIIILSAYSSQDKLLKAVTLGLSQYLLKPVPHKKLIALLTEVAHSYEREYEEKNRVHLQNNYYWKEEEKMLYYNEEVISLTKREIIFLDFMIQQVDSIVPSANILNLIWEDDESSVAYSALSHLLKRLKKKLPEELIVNIYGEGYRITSK